MDVNAVANQARKASEELVILARMLDGMKSSEVSNSGSDNSSLSVSSTPLGVSPKVVNTVNNRTYQNDPNKPGYDPEPSFKVDKVPARDTRGDGRLLVKEGTLIGCEKCKKIMIKVVRNVYDTKEVGKGIGLDAYEWQLGWKWGESAVIHRDKGGFAVDCPECNAVKSIWLYGRSENTQRSTFTEGAGSV